MFREQLDAANRAPRIEAGERLDAIVHRFECQAVRMLIVGVMLIALAMVVATLIRG